MTIQGSFEAVDHYSGVGWFAKGWAFDPEQPDAPIDLVLWSDGKPLAQFLANQYRSDLASAGLGSGHCSFEVALPEDLLDGRPHRLEIIVPREQRVLPKSTKDLFFPNFQRGQIERFEHATLEGWAVNMLLPDRPAVLDLLIDGKWVDIVVCDLPRPDLRDFNIKTDAAGFHLTLPERVFDDEPHEVKLVFSNTSLELEGSPQTAQYGPWLLTSRWKRIAENVKDAKENLAEQALHLAREPLNKLADRASYHKWLEYHEVEIATLSASEKIDSIVKIIDVSAERSIHDVKIDILKNNARAMCLTDGKIRLHDDFIQLTSVNFSNNKVKIVYTDYDHFDDIGARHTPHFLPDWDPDRHLEKPYTPLEIVVEKSVLISAIKRLEAEAAHLKLGQWRQALIDTILLDASETSIAHLPHVLLHRASVDDTWLNDKIRQSRLQSHLNAKHPGARVEALPDNRFRIHWPLPDRAPAVTMIVPTRDRLDLLSKVIDGLLNKTEYTNKRIIIIDNDSKDENTTNYLSAISNLENVTVCRWNGAFNYAAMHNDIIANIKTPYINLINNDIEVLEKDWLKEMMSLAIRPDVGAVGVKLLFPDDMIQHGGVVVGQHGVADNAQQAFHNSEAGYLNSTQVLQNVTAVTAACMVLRTSDYQKIAGMDATLFPVSFNDVDLCLKLKYAGYRILWTPHGTLKHFESASRGKIIFGDHNNDSASEALILKNKWNINQIPDNFYNKNLSRSLQTYTDFQFHNIFNLT